MHARFRAHGVPLVHSRGASEGLLKEGFKIGFGFFSRQAPQMSVGVYADIYAEVTRLRPPRFEA